jgi:hypothetical protein
MFDLNKKEKPFTSFGGFGGGGLGLAGGAIKLSTYVDDVFSTFVYDGTGATQSINNGIDLSGEGGLVWIKNRSSDVLHVLTDTERGATKVLYSNSESDEGTGGGVNAFNSNGFEVTGGANSNNDSPNKNYVSWTFRKAPGFLDIVTFQKTAGRMGVSHSLGSVPGMIIVKNIDNNQDWYVYHRSLTSNQYYMRLSNSAGEVQNSGVWNAETPTSTEFAVGTVLTTNDNYIAYVFAHDNAQYGTDEDESIIKCGSFTTSSSKATVELGFEPQWVMLKGYSGSSPGNGWEIYDNIRGLSDVTYSKINANETAAEVNGNVPVCGAKATGFQIENTNNTTNFIYVAIRRPNKPPASAIEVFAIDTRGGTSPTPPTYKSGFPVDWSLKRNHTTTHDWQSRARLSGTEESYTNLNNAASKQASTTVTFDRMDGVGTDTGVAAANQNWMFKRAPGFMDVVTFKGTGTNSAGTQQVVNHNLEVSPELVIVKNRDSTKSFFVWSSYMTEKYRMKLDDTHQQLSGGDTYWQANSTFTATQFGLGYGVNTNKDGDNHVAYLFASLAGISKIGTFSGTGSNVNVDCGFSSGARFVMIKRTDAEVTGTESSGWYIWDTTRGIASGNDPYLRLDSNAAQVTNTDYIDPLSAGFTVTSSASASLNADGGTYLFLAIA